MLAYPSTADSASRLARPCRVVSGTDDSLVRPEEARQLAVLCRADHVDIAGAGHTVPVEAAEQFNRVVLQFLQGR
jgi:pimeloyl-ACP methyl ester carboxylesterase